MIEFSSTKESSLKSFIEVLRAYGLDKSRSNIQVKLDQTRLNLSNDERGATTRYREFKPLSGKRKTTRVILTTIKYFNTQRKVKSKRDKI